MLGFNKCLSLHSDMYQRVCFEGNIICKIPRKTIIVLSVSTFFKGLKSNCKVQNNTVCHQGAQFCNTIAAPMSGCASKKSPVIVFLLERSLKLFKKTYPGRRARPHRYPLNLSLSLR